MLGYVINDRYKLVKTLGEGGFGVVYRAQDLNLSREVAIKILSINAQKDPSQAERFMAEARITSKLHHPNLVTLYDSGQVQSVSVINEHVLVGQLFLVTELLLGSSLERVLEHKVLDLPQTMSLLRQLAEGLAVAHEHGVIHRDIKPPNIFIHLINEREVVKLLDFGIAKVAHEQTHTLTGQLFGTPYYMSPEQIYGKKQLTHATDIYSLGVLLFHCLTGLVPFDGDSQYVIFNKHINEAVPPLSLRHPELSRPEIQGVVEALMAKSPQDRPQSAHEVLEILESLEALCPHWFQKPQPLLEGVPLNRGDTERVRLSELNTGELSFEATPQDSEERELFGGDVEIDDELDEESTEPPLAVPPPPPTLTSAPPAPPAQQIPPPLLTSGFAPMRSDEAEQIEIELRPTMPFLQDARLALLSLEQSRAERTATVAMEPPSSDRTLYSHELHGTRTEHTGRVRTQSASVWGLALLASAALIVVGALWSSRGPARPSALSPQAAPLPSASPLSSGAQLGSQQAPSALLGAPPSPLTAEVYVALPGDPIGGAQVEPLSASRSTMALPTASHRKVEPLPRAQRREERREELREEPLAAPIPSAEPSSSAGARSTSKRPVGKPPAGALAEVKSPTGKRPTGKRPTGKRPTGKRPTGSGQAAHTPPAPPAQVKPTPAPPAPPHDVGPARVELLVKPKKSSIAEREALSFDARVLSASGKRLPVTWELLYWSENRPSPVKSISREVRLTAGKWFFKACAGEVCSKTERILVVKPFIELE